MVVLQEINPTAVNSMLETDKVFAGSVPEYYDRYMVPLIFEPYAADLARRHVRPDRLAPAQPIRRGPPRSTVRSPLHAEVHQSVRGRASL